MPEDRKYWDEVVETMPLDKLQTLQKTRLQAQVARAYERTALYRRKFDKAGVKPADIITLDDIRKLPLTEYLDDFCETPLLDKMAVPLDDGKAIGSTSGTLSGFSHPVFRTQKEWENLLDVGARSYWMAGVRPKDRVQVLTGIEASRRSYAHLGTAVLLDEAGRRNLDFQIKLTQVVGITIIEHLPSLVLRYFERAEELGIDIRQTELRLVIGTGEGWAETYKKKIEKKYGVAFQTYYGAYELGCVSTECQQRQGMHIHSDHFIVEVIDPETLQLLDAGQEGELIITSITADAMPLIRYHTGDIGTLLPYESCSCGRTHPKVSLIRGRVAQVFKVQGKKLLPIDVEAVVASIPELGDEYQVVIDSPDEVNKLKVRVEHAPGQQGVTAIKNKTEEALYQKLGVDSEVEILAPGNLTRTLFKAQRMIHTYK